MGRASGAVRGRAAFCPNALDLISLGFGVTVSTVVTLRHEDFDSGGARQCIEREHQQIELGI
jgi:hypothetical protein